MAQLSSFILEMTYCYWSYSPSSAITIVCNKDWLKNSNELYIINKSITSSIWVFEKCHLNKFSRWRCLLCVRLHKEPGLKAWYELFLTNVSILQMRRQHVPSLQCNDMKTVWTITHSPSTWHDHIVVVSRAKPGAEGDQMPVIVVLSL